MDSILNSVKRYLRISKDFKEHDEQLIRYINGAFNNLSHIKKFKINDDTSTWHDFTDDEYVLKIVKLYISEYIDNLVRKLNNFHLTEAEKWQCTAKWLNAFYRAYCSNAPILSVNPCENCIICYGKHGYKGRNFPQDNFKVLEQFTGANTIVGRCVDWGIL